MMRGRSSQARAGRGRLGWELRVRCMVRSGTPVSSRTICWEANYAGMINL
jgi:hypothetical protein